MEALGTCGECRRPLTSGLGVRLACLVGGELRPGATKVQVIGSHRVFVVQWRSSRPGRALSRGVAADRADEQDAPDMAQRPYDTRSGRGIGQEDTGVPCPLRV